MPVHALSVVTGCKSRRQKLVRHVGQVGWRHLFAHSTTQAVKHPTHIWARHEHLLASCAVHVHVRTQKCKAELWSVPAYEHVRGHARAITSFSFGIQTDSRPARRSRHARDVRTHSHRRRKALASQPSSSSGYSMSPSGVSSAAQMLVPACASACPGVSSCSTTLSRDPPPHPPPPAHPPAPPGAGDDAAAAASSSSSSRGRQALRILTCTLVSPHTTHLPARRRQLASLPCIHACMHARTHVCVCVCVCVHMCAVYG